MLKASFYAQRLREHHKHLRISIREYFQRAIDNYILFCEADQSLRPSMQHDFKEFQKRFALCMDNFKAGDMSYEAEKLMLSVMADATFFEDFFREEIQKFNCSLKN